MEAQQFFQTGDPEGAIRLLEKGEEQFGPTASSALLKSDIYFFVSDHHQALAAIGDAIVLASREGPVVPVESIVRKAAILTLLNRQDAALELLARLPLEGRKASFFRALRQAIVTKDDIAAFESVAAPSFFRKDISCLTALNHYAILLRDRGDARASIVVARERFLKASSAFRFGRDAKPSVKPGWVDEAAVCLADLEGEFEKAGIPFFLISGTFLGAHRDHNIIGHDKDIDVGVDESVSVEALLEAFSASSLFSVKDIPSRRCVYLAHANGVSVDVFVHYREGGRYWHEGVKVRWWNSPFDLVEIPFLGGTYKVPADADLYLTENYGEWRTPVADFETFVDTPNMEVTSREHVVWYYLTKLTDYYLLGRIPQFSRVWLALEAMHPVDDELRAAARRVVEYAALPPLKSGKGLASVASRAAASREAWLPRWAVGPGRMVKQLGRAALRKRRAAADGRT